MTRSPMSQLKGVASFLAFFALWSTPVASQTAARQGLLSLEDARIYYEVVGTGDPIIVVHGGPGLDHRYLRPGLDALARRNTLIYYDQRATGRSSATLDEASINLHTFVRDIDALRDALGFEQVSVLTHSFGTLIGLEYALQYPDRLTALILMNPVEPGARFAEQIAERQLARRTEQDSVDLAELRDSEGFAARDAATLSEAYRIMFRPALRDRSNISNLVLDLQPSTAKNGQDVARLLAGGLGPVDWWDRLAGVEAPTLVLHGRFDIPPEDMSLALAEAFPVGTYTVLDSGHFPYLEDREGLMAAISGFFAGLGR